MSRKRRNFEPEGSLDEPGRARNYGNPSRESIYSLRLKEWSRQIPIAGISKKWEECILDLIPDSLKDIHPRCLEKTLAEVREDYEREMMSCAIASIVDESGAGGNADDECSSEAPYDRRCEHYYPCNVPRYRQLLANKYVLSHEIMRRIIHVGSVKLARVAVNLDDIVDCKAEENLFDISTLTDAMTSAIAGVTGAIRNEYYPEVVKTIATTIGNGRRSLRAVGGNGNRRHLGKGERADTRDDPNRKARLLRCAENLFAQRIVEMMMKTIDELTERLGDYRLRCPRLSLRLVWKNEDRRLSVDPPMHRVCSMWHSIVRSIESIADDLPRLDQGAPIADDDHDHGRMKIALPDWYVNESHRKIDEALAEATNPLERYFTKIAEEFEPVTSGDARRRVTELVARIGQLEKTGDVDAELSSKVKVIDGRKERANEMAESVDTFVVGRLDQSNARQRLAQEIADTRTILVNGMLLRHERYNRSICRDFEDLRDKLLDVPSNARELFRLSETIAHSSMSVLLEEFESRVAKSIEMLNSLLAVTSEMSESHTILNATTIKWLADIRPMIARSNTLCEAMKSELEDELQRRIARLNADIEAVLPEFEVLDYMDDADRVDDYEEHLFHLVDRLNRLYSEIRAINFEEGLFKFPETSFPNVEEIRDILVPVKALNVLAKKWRRDHAVWLHGPFEHLDAAEVRRKTMHHYREAFEKLNASLRAKIKNDLQSSSAGGASSANARRLKLYTGVVDDPDPMQQPAPLTLCSRILDEVKRFEGHLELVDCVCNPSLRERHWREISIIYEQNRKTSGNDSDRSSSLVSSALGAPGGRDAAASEESLIMAPDAGTTLAKLIRLDLAKDMEKYRVVSISADKELALADRLREMIAGWDKLRFDIVPTSGSSAVKTFAHLDEINALIEEHEVVIGEMRVSHFVAPVAADLTRFSSALAGVKSVVRAWLRVQSEWFELETVFRRETTHEHLAQARNLFFDVRVNVIRAVEQSVTREPNFNAIAGRSSELSRSLSHAEETLETVRATVESFLEKVRNLFPKFFFVSDRQVVNVLFEPGYSRRMRLFVRACFADISGVRCSSPPTADDDDDNSRNGRVTAIIDGSGQELPLVHPSEDGTNNAADSHDEPPLLVRSFVLTERAIMRTVRDSVAECFSNVSDLDKMAAEDPKKDRVLSAFTDCPLEAAGVCNAAVYWTSRIESALDHPDGSTASVILGSCETEQSCMMAKMSAQLKSNEISRIRRKILVLFIIEFCEQRDITRLLMSKVTESGGRITRGDFAWTARIRHYWQENRVSVAIFDTEEPYGYEFSSYVGREPIVRTPLTERCYHSLMEAHRNRRHGLVFGPGATGKTSSVEALARTLGVYLRVYDCGQRHLDHYCHMDKVFRGLVGCSSGSSCWLLFKNIDLVTSRGMSIFAQRVTSISSMIENRCFIAATVSTRSGLPSSRPRLSLPDTIKVWFRPVAFASPDTKRIAEVLLFAEGFSTAAQLAEKLRLFDKHSRRSSARDAYNPDSRATKAVVKTACALKRTFPNEEEDALLLRAVVDVYLPRFADSSSLEEFRYLTSDLFENVALPPPRYERLVSAIQRVLKANEIALPSRDPSSFMGLTLKIIQLFEMLFVRHAVLVVGSSLAGKTTVIDTLARSLTSLDRGDPSLPAPAVESVRINHNSFTTEDLLGDYDQSSGGSGTLRWKDGILTRALRSFEAVDNRERGTKSQRWQWLVLDGPLDAPFIHRLTTLLDEDCKTLLLKSGEKIRLEESTSIVLETSSMIEASPATISRCGIVFLEEASTIGWKMRTKRWIVDHQRDDHDLVPRSSISTGGQHRQDNATSNADEYAIFLQSLLEWSLGACLAFMQRNLDSRRRDLPTNENHMVSSVIRLLEIYLSDALGRDDHRREQSRSPAGSTVTPSSDLRHRSTERQRDGVKKLEDERAKSYVDNFFSWSQGALLMSIIWGLGGSLDRNSRVSLDEFCRSVWRANAEFPYDVIGPPSEGLIQDSVYVFVGSGCWRNFSDIIKKENINCDNIDYFWSCRASPTCYVPTIDSMRYIGLFEAHVKRHKPFVISGETAAGKTLLMRHLLKTKMDQKRYRSNFHSFTNVRLSGVCSSSVQNLFISRMKKLSKGVYGPKDKAELCINFVDDMSVTGRSKVETILRELIRQYHEDPSPEGCWRDVDSDERIRLKDALFLGAIDSGANRIDTRTEDFRGSDWHEAARFFRHFNLYTIDNPPDQSVFRIFHKILLANLRANMFSADVSASVTSIVNATLDLYSSISQTLRPVPANMQYRFNLRDVSRLVDGCSLIHKESAETKVTLMRLWVHESIRVFGDRILDETDADWLFVRMRECAASHFKDSWETAFDNLPKNCTADRSDQLTRDSFRHLVFTDFMHLPEVPPETEKMRGNANSDDTTKQQHRYEETTYSRDALKNRAMFYLERFNARESNTRKLDLIMFPQMLEHLIRICRILDVPGASLLMITFGTSSGRRSLTALAAHIKAQRLEELSCRVVESIMTPGSSVASWREDFKRACVNCIGEGNDDVLATGWTACSRIRDCTFFVSDRDIIGSSDCRSILGDICSLMKTGQTGGPDFFSPEERDDIVKRCRLLAQRGDRNLELSSLQVMDYFFNECQEKLHFVLCFDRTAMIQRGEPGREVFGKIIRYCAVDCFESWPEAALDEIGSKFMRDIDIDARARVEAIAASKYFWRDAILTDSSDGDIGRHRPAGERRRLPVSAYIHMVELYGLTIDERQKEIRKSREKYLSGLDKLKSADEEVRKMRSTLTRLRPELESSAMETTETMRKIETENVSVEMASVQVKREEEAANEIAKVASILKEECEADLAVAIPILEDAIAALNTLKPTDITLVKAMKNPPDTVKLVLAAVCVMLGVPPDRSTDPVTGKKSIDYWAPSKRILGDMNFLQNLKDYDKDNIPASVMSVVVKCYMNDENFMPHIVAKASSAAEGLCKWVRAMVSYDEVAKVVAPKKEKLAAAERECNAILEYLNEKRTSLAALNDKLAVLNASLQATLAKKLQLENEVTSCTRKLKRAETLIASLAGEKNRWLEAADTLTRKCDNLVGDILLSCGMVALLSSFDANKRCAHIAEWKRALDRRGIQNSGESYDFLGSLETDELRYPCGAASSTTDDSWHRHRHGHRLSVNSAFNRANASILEHTLLWPLILDPQNQANTWIKLVESPNGLVVVKPSNPRWFAEIRTCIDNDLPVLIENLDRPEYLARTPSILRYYRTSSAASYFRLYMTSRISFNEASASRRLVQPHDMYKRFNVVNFTLANDALQDHLLEIIVSRERPELRDTFDRLMITSTADKRLLDQEENTILEILSGSSVNIIEDERATEKLDRWKNLTNEMRTKEAETARTTEREMNEIRTTYRPLTKYCAALYDTLANLVNFNHMYRFSLDWFIRLYVRSIDMSMRSVVLKKRLTYLGSSFTLTLDASVRNALRDEHKLLYSFFLSIKILLDADKMSRTELRTLFFVNAVDFKCEAEYSLGSVTQTASMEIKKKELIVQQLAKALPEVFQNLPTSLSQDSASWEAYWNNEKALPTPWNLDLTDFQRLILVNALRPEKTLVEVLRLVENTLGWNSITSTSSMRMRNSIMARSYDESSCIVPLIFVLPSYLEPHRQIEKWAEKIGYSSRIVRYSMPPTSLEEYSQIENEIDKARKHGGWILLENCHLASDEWLARLEKISESLCSNDDTALSFRLWLTSYPSDNFPISILHDGTKIYCEQPSDRIKQSLLDFYATEPLDDPDFYDTRSGGNNPRIFSKLVYALCFFHATVTGRNRFNDVAWNVPSYEFTDSDLKVSIGYLRRVFRDGKNDERSMIDEGFDIKEKANRKLQNLIDTLTYLVGECYYGGRILDPIDRRILNVILSNRCNSRLVRSTSNYSFDDETPCSTNATGHRYSVPNRTEYRDFVRHIKDCLPSGEAPPPIFGLDHNAAVLRDRQNSDQFIHSLARSLSFIDTEMSARADEQSLPRLLAIVHDIRTKLNLEDASNFKTGWLDVARVESEYPSNYDEPFNSFLTQQVQSYNRIVETIGSSLETVERSENECGYELTESLTRNRVPIEWSMIAGSDVIHDVSCFSLSRFIGALSDRRDFLNGWIKIGHYRGSIWLGGLFECKRFVLAARLTFSRKSGIPLDRLIIDYEVTDTVTDHAKPWQLVAVPADVDDVIHVHGLHLSGARWDTERCTLVETLPKFYWNSLPMMRLKAHFPEPPSIEHDERIGNYYCCPVNVWPNIDGTQHFPFLGSLSINYVTTVPLHSEDILVQHWIERRTLLFCNK